MTMISSLRPRSRDPGERGFDKRGKTSVLSHLLQFSRSDAVEHGVKAARMEYLQNRQRSAQAGGAAVCTRVILRRCPLKPPKTNLDVEGAGESADCRK